MQPNIEITPDGRLLQRRQVETPNGKREKVRDITDEAQHWLDASVTLQSGTRLSAIYELLKANAALRALYKRNWADEYLARYEAICSGQVVPTARDDAPPKEPAIEALVLSRHQEMRFPARLLSMIVDSPGPKTQASERYLSLMEGSDSRPTDGIAPIIREAFNHWHISGRSVPFAQDTELWGVHYKAGSRIDYSVSFSFDDSIDLPICIGPGCVTLTITGQRRKDRLTVTVPLGTEQEPPMITLHELIRAITHEFSFHGGPAETQAEREKLKQVVDELDDARHAEDLRFGAAHLFCPDGDLTDIAARGHDLEDTSRYWERSMVLEHTGWTEAELKVRRRQGRVLELRSAATETRPRHTAYPVEQFIPGFDTELFRFLNWVASMSCSEWATHRFLTDWRTGGLREPPINGWAVLALSDVPITHEPLTDEPLKGVGKQVAPMRPIFSDASPKHQLLNAFEAFASQRRLVFESRDDLEEDD